MEDYSHPMARFSTDQTERIGVEGVRYLTAAMGWFVREPVRPDHGVDLFIETSDDEGKPNGRLIAVQVKAGASYSTAETIEIRFDDRHRQYWLNHSLPVIMAVFDVENEVAYWRIVDDDTTESTGENWKVAVPRSQRLDADSSSRLAEIASAGRERPPEWESLSRLRADLTWMQVLAEGGTVYLEAQEWIHKSSGRGDLTLVAEPPDGSEPIEKSFLVLAGSQDYASALPSAFPWADLQMDEDYALPFEEEQWNEETGIWDSEGGRYILNSESFAEWQAANTSSDSLRPYGETMGEVALWRLQLVLNDLGRGVLALERTLPATGV